MYCANDAKRSSRGNERGRTRFRIHRSAQRRSKNPRRGMITTAESESGSVKNQDGAPIHPAPVRIPNMSWVVDTTLRRFRREMLQALLFYHVLNGYAGPGLDVIPSTLYCVPIPNGSINLCAPFSKSARLSPSCVPCRSFCSRTDAPIPVRKAFCVIIPWLGAPLCQSKYKMKLYRICVLTGGRNCFFEVREVDVRS